MQCGAFLRPSTFHDSTGRHENPDALRGGIDELDPTAEKDEGYTLRKPHLAQCWTKSNPFPLSMHPDSHGQRLLLPAEEVRRQHHFGATCRFSYSFHEAQIKSWLRTPNEPLPYGVR